MCEQHASGGGSPNHDIFRQMVPRHVAVGLSGTVQMQRSRIAVLAETAHFLSLPDLQISKTSCRAVTLKVTLTLPRLQQ
jgi:hypothetical protein